MSETKIKGGTERLEIVNGDRASAYEWFLCATKSIPENVNAVSFFNWTSILDELI